MWEDEETEDGEEDTAFVDCGKLTSCDWEGMHPRFLGDGICNDKMGGCYNTEICGWDGTYLYNTLVPKCQ